MAKRGNHSRRKQGSGPAAVKAVLLGCILLVMIAAGSTFFSNSSGPGAAVTGTTAPPSSNVDNLVNTPDTQPSGGEASTPESAPPSGAPSQRPSANITPGTAAAIGASLSVTVPENGRVDDSYFSDAVFVGDSRTEGLRMYSGISPSPKLFSGVGLTVTKVFSDQIVQLNGQWLTVADALRQADYNKVYIMLGMNELGWVYESVYAQDYGRIIDVIRETHPDATIYVQSIIPVSKWKDTTDPDRIYTNANVVRLQKVLCEMCEEKNVHYVNVAEVMQDENGYLFSEATEDGMHLTQEYCKIWAEYLRTHTV